MDLARRAQGKVVAVPGECVSPILCALSQYSVDRATASRMAGARSLAAALDFASASCEQRGRGQGAKSRTALQKAGFDFGRFDELKRGKVGHGSVMFRVLKYLRGSENMMNFNYFDTWMSVIFDHNMSAGISGNVANLSSPL